MTLKLKAWKSGVPESAVARADYEISGALAGGANHSVAVKADGTLWAWGSNASGQLGIPPSGGTRTSPAAISGVSDIVAVAAGNDHTLALKRDGTVWSWGYNNYGQLGNGNTTQQNSPVQVSSLTDVVAVAAGQFHSVALKADGTVWIWGYTGVTYGSTPVAMSGLKGITKIAAAYNHSFALQTDGQSSGTLWVWGTNELDFFGNGSSLGDGTLSSRTTPVRVAGLQNVVDIQASYTDAFAILADQTVWTWGDNMYGEFGNQTTAYSISPIMTPVDTSVSVPTRIAAGHNFTLQLQLPSTLSNSKIEAWGLGSSGSLGDGTGDGYYTYPVPNLMTNARMVVAAIPGRHALAVALDGAVWSWGGNGSGQVGDGTTSTRRTPAAISGFSIADSSWLTGDADSDGLSNWLEMDLRTDPGKADSNGDGISDLGALRSGISATRADMDGDGRSNAEEVAMGTDPFRSDTDGDGQSDLADCFPLDSTRFQCPSPGQGDTTPPTITLTAPTNATLIGTNP